jgi:para-nitrobenzyl esterase
VSKKTNGHADPIGWRKAILYFRIKGYMMQRLVYRLIFAAFLPLSAFAQGPIVQTTYGPVEGVAEGQVRIFKGIPFAAPPVGELRWAPPKKHAGWTEKRLCAAFGPSAMQTTPVPFAMWTEEFIAPPAPLSEDCLTLNIWTAGKSRKDKLPVVVWIHGGGFVGGAASCAVYDGKAMAERGIVLVSINYRLGVFGFLAHPELTAESGKQASGNYGLMDQAFALQWVRDNIAAFGGDPNTVTIAGQSAGSISVNALVASPQAKGLFQRAISQSGGLLSGRFSRSLADAEASGMALQKAAGAQSLAALRAMPAAQVLEYASKMPFGSFSPVADGYFLPTDIEGHFRKGLHADVPLMTGWVSGDGGLMGTPNLTLAQFRSQAEKTYGPRANEYLGLFQLNSDEDAKSAQLTTGMLGFAGLPAHKWAMYNTQPVFIYEDRFVPTDKLGFPNYGAFHTSEVPFAYHTLAKWNRPWQKRDYDIEKLMTAYWVNFISTGNPNGKGLPAWNPYDREKQTILVINETTQQRTGLYRKLFAFFEVQH